MIKLSPLALAALLGVSTTAHAQIKDSEQKKAWFYLQHLAGEAHQLDTCITLRAARDSPKYNGTQARKRYYALVDELAREVEEYIRKYATLAQGTDETAHAFAYRVWSVTLSVGAQKRVTSFNDPICTILASP